MTRWTIGDAQPSPLKEMLTTLSQPTPLTNESMRYLHCCHNLRRSTKAPATETSR